MSYGGLCRQSETLVDIEKVADPAYKYAQPQECLYLTSFAPVNGVGTGSTTIGTGSMSLVRRGSPGRPSSKNSPQDRAQSSSSSSSSSLLLSSSATGEQRRGGGRALSVSSRRCVFYACVCVYVCVLCVFCVNLTIRNLLSHYYVCIYIRCYI